MPKLPHQRALDVLIHRGARSARVHLRNGQICVADDLAWGFDLGDDVAHITTNSGPADPSVERVIDFFRADDIMRIEDAETGVILFEAP